MQKIIKAIQEKLGSAALPARLLLLGGLFAFGAAVAGISAFPKLLFGHTTFTLDEQWSITLAAFVGGYIFQLHQRDASEFAHLAHGVKGKSARWLVGLSIFIWVLVMSSDVSPRLQDIANGLPAAFYALGTFLLVVGLPWYSVEELRALESQKTRSSFRRYVVQGIKDKASEWIVVASYSDNEGHMRALMREQQEANTKMWRELRVVFEVGSVDLVSRRAA